VAVKFWQHVERRGVSALAPDFLMELHGRGFPRSSRLTQSVQFERVFAEPKRVSNKGFTLLARKNDIGFARLGLAISKKCAARAVQRNRIKRQARETFRMKSGDLADLDIIVLCRPPAATMSRTELSSALDQLWNRLIQQCRDF
jgi:ribonuclease P protein component